MRFEPHFEPNIRLLMESHPSVEALRVALHERGLNERSTEGFLRTLLRAILGDAADRYTGASSQRLRRIQALRERLHLSLAEVIAGRPLPAEMTPESLNGLFEQLQAEMRALHDPQTFINENPPQPFELDLTNDPAASSDAHSAPGQGEQGLVRPAIAQWFEHLSQVDQALFRRAREEAGQELGSLILSESEGAVAAREADLRARLAREGFTPDEINRIAQLARDAGHERARLERGPGGAEYNARAIALNALPADLRALVEGDRFLENLAHDNPQMLAELANLYRRNGGSSRSGFRAYVRQRMVTHIAGMHGEFIAAFQLGEHMTILKPPDTNVTIPGTDIVGVLANGELWLIDNKSLSQSTLDSVSSLTRNLPGNMADDSAALSTHLADMARQGIAADPNVVAAAGRLAQATTEIGNLTRGMTPDQVAEPAIQSQIQAILNRHNIRRVVTNASSEVTGLSTALQNIGIELHDPGTVGRTPGTGGTGGTGGSSSPPPGSPPPVGPPPTGVPPTGAASMQSNPTPRVPPRGTLPTPELRVASDARLNPGQWTINHSTGETVICNYTGLGHERMGTENALPSGIEVGLPGWHRAHSQGAGLNESAHGILYAPPEVNLGYQNLGIETFMRDTSRMLPPETRMVLTTATRAQPGGQHILASIQYKIEIEVNGVRTRIIEAGIDVQNIRDNPRVDIWAQQFADIEPFLPPLPRR